MVGHMLQIAVIPAEPWVTETISAVTCQKSSGGSNEGFSGFLQDGPLPVVNRAIVITAIINDLING